jgi:hypothetical protein
MGGRAFDQEFKKRYLELIAQGVRPRHASEQLGFTYQTVAKHLREDNEFLAAYNEASRIVDEKVEARLFDAATDPEVYRHNAVEMWLKHRNRPDWGDVHVHEISGPGGGPIQVGAAIAVAVRGALTNPETRDLMLDAIDVTPAALLPSPEDQDDGR